MSGIIYAQQVYLEIEFPEEINLRKAFRYSPEYKKNYIKIPLNNMNMGLTQVVLCEFEWAKFKTPILFKANLNFFSINKQKNVRLNTEISLKPKKINAKE